MYNAQFTMYNAFRSFVFHKEIIKNQTYVQLFLFFLEFKVEHLYNIVYNS